MPGSGSPATCGPGIEVQDGRIVDCGYAASGQLGLTTVSVVGPSARFEPVRLQALRHDPEVRGRGARFVQTTAARAPLPAPRTVADGTTSYESVGASKFPRHWIYDRSDELVAKAGLADFSDWYHAQFGERTPWGRHDSRAYVTAVETAPGRRLSTTIVRGGIDPEIRTVGERVVLERGRRSATLQAQTNCRLAVAPGSSIDRDALSGLAEGHRREEGRS